MEKKRLFVDMDGTLAEYRLFSSEEQYFQDGYYYSLKPFENVVEAIREIIKDKDKNSIEVFSLSAYPQGANAKEEKNAWLDKYLPELDSKHRIFTLCGQSKRDFIEGGVNENDYLLDDYTVNLLDWQKDGKGIKLLNGLNSRAGTWSGSKISYKRPAKELASAIVSIIRDDKNIIQDDIKEVQLRNEKLGLTIFIPKDRLEDIVKERFPEYKNVDDFRKNYTSSDWEFIKRFAPDLKVEETISLKQFDFEYKTLCDKLKDKYDTFKRTYLRDYSDLLEMMKYNVYSLIKLDEENTPKEEISDNSSKENHRTLKLSSMTVINTNVARYGSIVIDWNHYEDSFFNDIDEDIKHFINKYDDKNLLSSEDTSQKIANDFKILIDEKNRVKEVIDQMKTEKGEEFLQAMNSALENQKKKEQERPKRILKLNHSVGDMVLEDEDNPLGTENTRGGEPDFNKHRISKKINLHNKEER